MDGESACPFKKRGQEQSVYCVNKKLTSQQVIAMEEKYAAHNYHPMPVVFEKAEGCVVWDPEGKKYFDFLSAYSAVNQGHCHPKILQALTYQAQQCTLSSRAFYNSVFPRFAKYVTSLFGYDMMLPMNTGAEGVETAMKTARKWGYEKKGIPTDQAVIISCTGCFHGRSVGVISMSNDPDCRSLFGPFLPGLVQVEYNNVASLKEALAKWGKVACGFILEPIQGEAGVVVPDEGYLSECYALCKEHNVLFIADEIQTGIARTGRLIACEWENVRPDILILGKALSGGILPISCILADKDVLLCIKPGEHGSTYGGNPLASAVGIAALEVVKQEKLVERADVLGEKLRAGLRELQVTHPFIKAVRGKGLLNAIVIDENFDKTAWDLCLLFKERGLLAKPTHGHIIRLAPPLVMTDEQLDECLHIIRGCVNDIVGMKREDLAALDYHPVQGDDSDQL